MTAHNLASPEGDNSSHMVVQMSRSIQYAIFAKRSSSKEPKLSLICVRVNSIAARNVLRGHSPRHGEVSILGKTEIISPLAGLEQPLPAAGDVSQSRPFYHSIPGMYRRLLPWEPPVLYIRLGLLCLKNLNTNVELQYEASHPRCRHRHTAVVRHHLPSFS